MLDYFIPLLRNLTLITAVAVIYTIVPKRQTLVPDNVVVGLVCGFGACLAMLDPVMLPSGAFIDTRSTMLLLSGLFGGPVGALVATFPAAALRVYLGGFGMLPGTAGILLAGAIGTAVFYGVRRDGRPVALTHLVILIAVSPLTFVAIFVLPLDVAMGAIERLFLTTTILRMVGIGILGILLIHERRRLAAEDRIRQLAGVDELSGLANRRSFYRALERAIERRKVQPFDFSVVLIDLDHFKSVNDRFGHHVGDEVIRALARILKDNTRGDDVAARIGGEEFAVLLSGANRDAAQLVCERIRVGIAESVVMSGNQKVPFTASLGIATSSSFSRSATAMMSAADTALYLAKQNGRDRVVTEAFP